VLSFDEKRLLITTDVFTLPLCNLMSRDSSVSIATRYGLEGLEIESRWLGRGFPHPSRPSLLYSGYWVIPVGKDAGTWRWPPTPI